MAPPADSDPPAVSDDLDAFAAHADRWFTDHAAAIARVQASADIDRARDLQRSMHDAGLVGVHWPVEHGGRGLTPAHQRVIDEQARRHSLPALFTIGVAFIGPTLLQWGTPEQQARHLRRILRADDVWCELFSEPGAGSDLASAQCAAVRDADGWCVTGQKVWTSGAHHSRFGLLLARTDPTVPRHGGLSVFILDLDRPGVVVRPLRQMTGASGFNEVFLDGVRVDPDGLVGRLGGGWAVATTTLMHERAGIASSGGRRPGVLRTDDLVAAARATGQQHDPVVRDALARCWIAEQTTAWLAAAMKAKAHQSDPGPVGSLPKLALTALNGRTAAVGAQLMPGEAMAWEPDTASRWASAVVQAPSTGIAGGTTEVLKNLIGERLLGLPREPKPEEARR